MNDCWNLIKIVTTAIEVNTDSFYISHIKQTMNSWHKFNLTII